MEWVSAAFGKPQATISEEGENNESSGSSSQITSTTEGDSVDENQNKKKGMVLPFEPHSITFDEVVYSVDMPPVSNEKLLVS